MKANEFITEGKKGLWANIHAKQDRIKHGSGEHMRKPGSKGAPSAQDFKDAANEAANPAQQAAIAIAMKKAGKKPKSEGLEEGSQQVDSLVTDALKIMRGAEVSDAIQALKTVLGDREFSSRRGFYNFYIRQLVDMYGQRGLEEGENWSKHNHKRVGGMSDKSVKSYRRSHPGSKIQTAVTTKPSKIKKGSKDAKRRASFCARMRGMKKHRTSAKTANDPNSNINKSLRRWHCESVEQLEQLVMLAEQKIRNLKK